MAPSSPRSWLPFPKNKRTMFSPRSQLALPDPEHLSATYWTNSSGSWSAVLQGHLLWIPYLPFCSALEAIRLHLAHLLLSSKLPSYYILNVKAFGAVFALELVNFQKLACLAA